ncbi:MAG: hypothetical protein ACLSAF_05305 [Intestinimonas sp.]
MRAGRRRPAPIWNTPPPTVGGSTTAPTRKHCSAAPRRSPEKPDPRSTACYESIALDLIPGPGIFPSFWRPSTPAGVPRPSAGLAAVHRAHFAAGIRANTGRPVVLLCADETEAARLGRTWPL